MLTIILLLMLYNKINTKNCIYYYQNGDVGENIDLTTKAIFKKYSIIKTTDQSQALLYIPYSYNYIPQEIEKMPSYCNKYYFILESIHLFIGKENLCTMIKDYYKEEALDIIPESYTTSSIVDMKLFKKEFDSNKKYILKKNTQCQDNIVISSSYDRIMKLVLDYDKKYVIVQVLLQDPYLVLQRKINLRVYMLLIYRKGNLEVYIYEDGFIYYTPEFYVENSDKNEHNITTGYIDRSVYKTNPLTHKNLKTYMGKDRYQILLNNIQLLIIKIIRVYAQTLIETQPFKDSTMFELFGCDVAVNSDLSVKIMEINKGPDLGPKSREDAKLKSSLVEDMFELTNIITKKSNNNNNNNNNSFRQLFY
jgi:hypothetical protein